MKNDVISVRHVGSAWLDLLIIDPLIFSNDFSLWRNVITLCILLIIDAPMPPLFYG